MKKKGVNRTINFSNKTLYALIGIFAILIVSGVVYAYGSSNPSVMGHNLGEVQMPSCSEGQVLKYTSGAWNCGADNAGTAFKIVKYGDGQRCSGDQLYSVWCPSWGGDGNRVYPGTGSVNAISWNGAGYILSGCGLTAICMNG